MKVKKEAGATQSSAQNAIRVRIDQPEKLSSRERRTRAALARFDSLPNEALVKEGVVCALFAISPVTRWRRSKAGLIPAPIRQAGGTYWRVGALRRALAEANNATE